MSCLLIMLVAGVLALCGDGRWNVGASPRTQAAIALRADAEVDAEGGLLPLVAMRDGALHADVLDGARVEQGQIIATLRDDWLGVQVKDAAAVLRSAERKVEQLKSHGNRPAQVTAERDRAVAALSLNAHEYELEQHRMRAPSSGIIVRGLAKNAELVRSGRSLFLLAPDGPRVLRMTLHEADADAVQVGMLADATEPRSARVYKARIVSVKRAEAAAGKSGSARLAECLLTLDAPELSVGQRLTVRIGT